MYKKLGLILLATSMLLMPGCTKNEGTTLSNQEIVSLQKENEELKQTISKLEEEVLMVKEENETLKNSGTEVNTEEYTLYTRDVNSWEIIESSKIKIDETMDLKEKLQAVADELSKVSFKGLAIEVEEIKSIGNNEIAIINLMDDGLDKEPNWNINFFQGSTGAGITKTAIEESFLQRNIASEWIDGIEVHYNNEPLVNDHIEFSEIIYR